MVDLVLEDGKEKDGRQAGEHTHLFLLLGLWFGGGVGELLDGLPLLVGQEGSADGLEEVGDRLAHGGLEVTRVYPFLCKVELERRIGSIVGGTAAPFACDGEEGVLWGVGGGERATEGIAVLCGGGTTGVETELADGEEDGVEEGKEAVVDDVALLAEGPFDLAPDDVGGVEQVDLGVWVGGGHLAAHETGHHRVHEVGTLGIAETGEVELGEGEDLALRRRDEGERRRRRRRRGGENTDLVHAAELEVDVEVLLVEGLQTRVEEPAEQGAVDLLDDLCARLLGVVLGDERAEAVVVEGVLLR